MAARSPTSGGREVAVPRLQGMVSKMTKEGDRRIQIAKEKGKAQ